MCHDVGRMARTHRDDFGDGPYVRLDVAHRASYRAARLLEVLGGRHVPTAAGMVYGFVATPARDEALRLVRTKLSWTVADPFDGHPRLPGDPTARRLDGPSIETVFISSKAPD